MYHITLTLSEIDKYGEGDLQLNHLLAEVTVKGEANRLFDALEAACVIEVRALTDTGEDHRGITTQENTSGS